MKSKLGVQPRKKTLLTRSFKNIFSIILALLEFELSDWLNMGACLKTAKKCLNHSVGTDLAENIFI